MGTQTCGCNITSKKQQPDPLALNYGFDDRQIGIQHSQQDIQINCHDDITQQELNKYIKALKNQKSLYRDPSLQSDPVQLKSKYHSFNCIYKRPYNFIFGCKKGQSYHLINQQGCSPNSIQVKDQMIQYFGVFLCFLADKPKIIKSIICNNSNSYGIHCIKAHRDGAIVLFFIDDCILCRFCHLKHQPVFSQPQQPGEYMWPCIIQKAWFKLQGNCIQKVLQSRPQQLFLTFQPLPIQKYILDQISSQQQKKQKLQQIKQTLNKIFNHSLQNQQKNSYILRSKNKTQYDIGLSGSKYFYLLDILSDNNNKKLYYIRNPYTQSHFRGIHDKIPQNYQNIIKNKQKKQHIPHGNFLINQQQFIQQINEITVIYYRQNNIITNQQFICQFEKQIFIQFSLNQQGLFNLYLIQYALNQTKNTQYNPIIYHVIRLTDMELIGGYQNRGCFGSKILSLLDKSTQKSKKSKYLIRLKIKRDPTNQNLPNIKLNLNCYFTNGVHFQQNIQLKSDWENYFKLAGSRQFLKSARKKANKGQQIANIVSWIGDIAYVYIQKRSKKPEINIEVSFPNIKNLQCISHPQIKKSSDNWNSYKFTDNFVIIFQKIDLKAETTINEYYLETY